MQRKFGSKLTRAIPGVLASLLVSAGAVAAPYSITYSGTMNASTLPGVNSGEAYTVTLVMDNGGASAAGQTWNAGDLTCVLWTMNNANNVGFAQDLVASAGTMSIAGSATTGAGGALTANFSSVISNVATNYTVAGPGFALVDPVDWYLNNANNIMHDTAFARDFGDAAGGTQMAFANWTNPRTHSGACTAAAALAGAGRPIPTLSQWGMIILSSLLALGSIVMLRRRRG
jgi:hypothetical protein